MPLAILPLCTKTGIAATSQKEFRWKDLYLWRKQSQTLKYVANTHHTCCSSAQFSSPASFGGTVLIFAECHVSSDALKTLQKPYISHVRWRIWLVNGRISRQPWAATAAVQSSACWSELEPINTCDRCRVTWPREWILIGPIYIKVTSQMLMGFLPSAKGLHST